MSLPCRSSFSCSSMVPMVSSWSGTGAVVQLGKNSTALEVLIALVLGMQHLQFRQCSGALLMKNPSVPLSAHEPRSISLSCTSALVPATDIGCFMKSQCPCMMVHAETFSLILDGLSECQKSKVPHLALPLTHCLNHPPRHCQWSSTSVITHHECCDAVTGKKVVVWVIHQ